MSEARFQAEPVLARLKDFQRRTVDYVFDRLFGDQPTMRFLVADEVGLGKTLVARGVIARALEHLQDRVKRVDIIYVCSNAAIAAQNINRLNVTGKKDFALASRLTLLPLEVHQLEKNKVNFVSFTPGTTFDLKSRSGTRQERALIYRMLRGAEWDTGKGLLNLLQGPIRDREHWMWWANKWTDAIDGGLTNDFRAAILRDEALVGRLKDGCARFQRHRESVGRDDSELRYALIGELRHRLAETCLNALQPDLVILDEFQRFKSLLDGDDEGAMLARSLFNHKDVRTLLLSATPYKMLSLDHEQDDDHYPDFLRTLQFLYNEGGRVESVRKWIGEYRTELYALGDGQNDRVPMARSHLQAALLSVMCRTERVSITEQQDAMLVEHRQAAPLEPSDLDHARVADRAAQAVGAREPIEYWKSSPYVLNFLKNYELRRLIDDDLGAPPEALLAALRSADGSLLAHEKFDGYEEIAAANARLRVLFDDTLNKGLWRLLWMPPSLPYTVPDGAYANVGPVTKALVFSSWAAVPEAIAALTSYEAERRMVEGLGRKLKHSELYDRLKPLLRFALGRDGRLTGMPVLGWMLPSVALAKAINPLGEAVDASRRGETLTKEQLLARTKAVVEGLLDELPPGEAGPRADERWYWAAPVLLDAHSGLSNCLTSPQGWGTEEGEDDTGDRFHDHVGLLAQAVRGELQLGQRPSDLAKVVAELALAGPGTCALRALGRIAPSMKLDDARMLAAATQVAGGFRTLFNLPEAIALLRGDADGGEEYYWRRVLNYSLDGNLQSVLDEQVHILVEQLGFVDQDDQAHAIGVSESLVEALSIRTAQLRIDELKPNGDSISRTSFNTRCRFALRFGELKDDSDGTLARAETVRVAFNSPFRPFVLASTSIGQEGLDFHTWCHAVVHWNLPSNPVDLEQREGRVHRYKGHAVRKNIAEHYGLAGLAEWDGNGDPWKALFDRASADRPATSSDLVPYWLFENGSARVERRVPLIPFSREVGQLERLKRGLALYRVVFGQPRQEDLLAHLIDQLAGEEVPILAARWRMCLEPPRSPDEAYEVALTEETPSLGLGFRAESLH